MARRRAARWVLGIVGGLLLLAATSAVIAETDWFKERLRRIVVNRAGEALNGQLTVGQLTGSLLTGVELHHVALTSPSGPVLAVETLALRYDPRLLARGHLVFRELSLTRPVVHLKQTAEGWNVATLAKPTSGGKKTEVHFRKLTIVDGDVTVEPAGVGERRFSQLNASLGLSYTADRLQMNVDTLQARDVDTGWVINGGAVKLENSGDRMVAMINLGTNAGALAGTIDGQTDRRGGRAVGGHFTVNKLNLAPIVARNDLVSDITGNIQMQSTLPAEGAGAPTVAFQVEAPSVSAAGYSAQNVRANGSYGSGILYLDGSGTAFGAFATAKGEWRTASARRSPNVVMLAGRFRGLDIRRVPASFQAPKLASRLAGRYDFVYRPESWDVRLRFDSSQVEGAQIGAGTIASASMHGKVPEYDFEGRVAHLDLRRIGRALAIATLTQPRFRGALNGNVHVHGRGRSLNDTELQADADLENSTIASTRLPSANVRASLAHRALTIDFTGPFEHLTNELLGTGSAPMDLTGTSESVHVVLPDLRAPITIYTLEADGRLTLTHSIVAGYDIDQATVDASVANGAATLRTFEMDGAELNAKAKGTVAFDVESESNLTFSVDAQNLDTASRRFGVPIAGAAHVEGSVTGPSDHLTATGTLATQQFKYGTSFDALTLNGTFGVEVLNQQWRDAKVHAETVGTFVKLGGMEVDKLTTNVTYSASDLVIDTLLEQKTRTVKVGGNVLLHPDHREIHLNQLAITTSNQSWSLPAGQEATIQYGGERLAVTGFVLANGPEQVALNGVLGVNGPGGVSSPGLDLKVENLQLADVNQLLSKNWNVSGVVNGSARVSGTPSAPVIASNFAVSNGMVAKTTFQGLTAKVDYRDNKVVLDATLDQQPGAQLRASGTVPVAFGGASTSTGDAPMDLRVESTPINLGLFQAFTAHLNAMTGTGQFNLHVTGTPKAPRVDGNLDVANAAFTVPPLGVSYTNGNAKLRFDAGRILVDQFVIEDDDRHTLTVTGGAEVADGRQLRSVDLHIVAGDMHLLRNEFGEVGLDADLKASGGLQNLEITGDARVQRGRLEIDKLLERFNKGAYSTEAQKAIATPAEPAVEQAADQIVPPAADAEKKGTPAAKVAEAASGTLFDNMKINVSLRMPDDLILRARDLRLSEGAAGLGSTNLTVGGTLTARKDPGSKIVLLGGVEVVRGFYEFQGRRFDIVRGSEVRFRGNQPIDPGLNVTAEREISSVRTQVGLRGTAREPEITLSSYPPLDQSDILSLIVFGQPANSLGESQRVNLAQRAGNLALGAVASPLAESVGRALNLDLFEVRAEGQGGGPEVALGSQIGSRIFIGLRQEFGKEDVSTVSFEYRISKLLRLVTSVAQGVQQTHATRRSDPTGADLLFVIRY